MNWVMKISVMVVMLLMTAACGETANLNSSSNNSDISSSSSIGVTDNRNINVSIPNDLKLKLKLKLKSADFGLLNFILLSTSTTNWIVLAVSTSGDKVYASSADSLAFGMKLNVAKSYYIYIGQVVDNKTNLYLVSYPGALPVLPVRTDKLGGLSALNLGMVSMNAQGALTSENDPVASLAFTNSGKPFDADNDGIADFAGTVDKNLNGIPDAFENTQAITNTTVDAFNTALSNTNSSDYLYFTALFAAEPAMTIYNSVPVWSNSVVTFALNTNFSTFVNTVYAESWSNQVAEVALNTNWKTVVSNNALAAQWSNSVVLVVYDTNFQNVIPTNQAATFSNYTVAIQTNSNWAAQYTNVITNMPSQTTNFAYSIATNNYATNWAFVSWITNTNAGSVSNIVSSNQTISFTEVHSTNRYINSIWNALVWSFTNQVTNTTLVVWTNAYFLTNYVYSIVSNNYATNWAFVSWVTNTNAGSGTNILFSNQLCSLIEIETTNRYTNALFESVVWANSNYYTNAFLFSWTNTYLVTNFVYSIVSNNYATNLVLLSNITTNSGLVTNIIASNQLCSLLQIETSNRFVNLIDQGVIWSLTNSLTNTNNLGNATNIYVLTRIYVATNGNDANWGTINYPVQSLQEAISKAVSNNLKEIYIAGGTYLPTAGLNAISNGVVISNHNLRFIGGWDPSYTVQSSTTFLNGNNALYHVVFLVKATNILMDNFSIINGLASASGGVHFSGAGICMSNNSYCKFSNIIVSNNVASNTAGGIMMYYANYNIFTGTIVNNYARSSGGGIWAYASGCNLINANIYSNTAVSGGGGISMDELNGLTSNTIYGLVMSNQCTNGEGGGIYISSASNTVIYATIGYNYALKNGGGLVINSDRRCTFAGMIVSNYSGGSGGGIYMLAYQTYKNTISGMVISNFAVSNGGGMYVSSVTNNTNTGDISWNRSQLGNGGGVYFETNTFGNSLSNVYSNWAVLSNGVYDGNGGNICVGATNDNP